MASLYTIPGQVNYQDMILPAHMKPENHRKARDIKMFSSDILVTGYPKSGKMFLDKLLCSVTRECHSHC